MAILRMSVGEEEDQAVVRDSVGSGEGITAKARMLPIPTL
jgi:hypothetical protein